MDTKLLAVRRVTSNKGKRTPGIDGELCSTAAKKYEAALRLRNKEYKSCSQRKDGYLRVTSKTVLTIYGVTILWSR